MPNRLTNKVKKYWILFYYDDANKTFNPGLQTSDWSVVQEIERITCKLKDEGKKVHICTTTTVYDINDLKSQDDCINTGPEDYIYDPFLMW